MTFCVGIKVEEGVVALADTQIVLGSERISKKKLAALSHADDSLFAMTSGLRSVRDKATIYLNEQLEQQTQPYDRFFRIVNLFGDQLRKVRQEDGDALAASGLKFNTNAIIGGCLSADQSPQLFYMYPEGNWIESNPDSPYFIIGRTTYGKPILDRLLNFQTPLRTAVALAFLAFDSTRTSVTDVDCPIDVAVIPASTGEATYHRFSEDEINEVANWWSTALADALTAMPMEWSNILFRENS